MALLDRLRKKDPDLLISEVMEKYDIVEVHPEGAIIVAERPGAIQLSKNGRPNAVAAGDQTPDLRELGSTGTTAYGYLRQEYVSELRGIAGLRTYDQMRRGDARVRSSLRLMKTPVLSGRWYMEPASTSSTDRNVADFVWKNLQVLMSTSFPQMLTEALLMLDYGYYMFEKVFSINDTGKTYWQKFAPRHPLDVITWDFDANGGPAGVTMQDPNGGPGIPIPISKLLVFSFDKEAGNLEGMSVLRSAYKHWYYKDNLYKIDAIQKERHGIGVPIIKLPANFDNSDKILANDMGRNLRTNESAHIVLPPNWEILFAKLEGHPVDALASAEHHDRMISANILSEFLANSTTGGDGQDMFVKATRFVADVIRDVFNKYAIPQLVDYNWSKVGYPQLKVRRIGETTDWRTFSFALRNLSGAGILQPDDPLEDWIRDEMDLPMRDPATIRIVAAPQSLNGIPVGDVNAAGQVTPGTGEKPETPPGPLGSGVTGAAQPARVGPPRQSTTKGMKKMPGKGAGTDRSGG